jgi:hypothetical protein
MDEAYAAIRPFFVNIAIPGRVRLAACRGLTTEVRSWLTSSPLLPQRVCPLIVLNGAFPACPTNRMMVECGTCICYDGPVLACPTADLCLAARHAAASPPCGGFAVHISFVFLHIYRPDPTPFRALLLPWFPLFVLRRRFPSVRLWCACRTCRKGRGLVLPDPFLSEPAGKW